jgi:hypothetical protein
VRKVYRYDYIEALAAEFVNENFGELAADELIKEIACLIFDAQTKKEEEET